MFSELFGGGNEGGGQQQQTVINQRPEWYDAEHKRLIEEGRAPEIFGGNWQDYLDPNHAPTPEIIRRMEAARQAPQSAHHREALDLAARADPRNDANIVHDENVQHNAERLARESSKGRTGDIEARLRRSPKETYEEFRGDYERNVIDKARRGDI